MPPEHIARGYEVLNEQHGVLCERTYAVWPDLEALMRQHGVPQFTVDAHRPVGAFDLLGLSFSTELGYTNMLTALDLAGIPLIATDRDESHPIVVAGGHAAFNPEPIADFLDAAVLGSLAPRAEALRADFGAKLVVYDWVQAANMLEGAATVINTTSLGMAGKPEFRVPLDALEPGAVVNDLVYNPLKTAFLAEAEQRGATIVDGLGMLLHQAAPGFERWFGPTPAVDEATRQAVLSA